MIHHIEPITTLYFYRRPIYSIYNYDISIYSVKISIHLLNGQKFGRCSYMVVLCCCSVQCSGKKQMMGMDKNGKRGKELKEY